MSTQFDFGRLLRTAESVRTIATERIPQIKSRTLAQLERRMPVVARRDIESEYNLTSTRIRAGLSTRRIAGGVELIGSGRSIGLRNFGRSLARGYRVQVLKRNAPQLLRHAFVQVPGGAASATGPQLFERALENGKRAGRLPIKRLFGPTMASILRDPQRADRLGVVAQQVISAEIDRLGKL